MNELLKPFVTTAFNFEVETKELCIEDLKLMRLLFYRKDDLKYESLSIENNLKYSIKIQDLVTSKVITIYIEDKESIFTYLMDEEFELSKVIFNNEISYKILKDSFSFTEVDFGGLKLNSENLKEVSIYGNYSGSMNDNGHEIPIDTDIFACLFEDKEDKNPKEIIYFNRHTSFGYEGVSFCELGIDFEDLENKNLEEIYDEKIVLKLDEIPQKINCIKIILKIYLAQGTDIRFEFIKNPFLKFQFKDGEESKPLLLENAPDFKSSNFYEVCNFTREDDGEFLLQTSFKEADVEFHLY